MRRAVRFVWDASTLLFAGAVVYMVLMFAGRVFLRGH